MFFSFIISLLALSFLVLIHELGHFWAAKKEGIEVKEFGLGYPPRLWGIKRGETIYSVNLIPFGGFVRIEEEPLWRRSKNQRARVYGSGILANFFLAVAAFSLVYFSLGIPQKQGFVEIVGVAEGSPAEGAGIQKGATVVSVAGQPIRTNQEFIEIVNQNLGEEIELTVKVNNQTTAVGRLSKFLKPRKEPPEGQGPLGVAISDTKMRQVPFWQRPFVSLWFGVKEAVGWVGAIVWGVGRMLFNLVFKKIIPQDIAGPVGIFQVATDVSQKGVWAMVQFVGVLSVNLAVLNFLPIPALDGGRLLFVGLEWATGRKPRPSTEKLVHTIGLAILFLLMLAVTYQDLQRIF